MAAGLRQLRSEQGGVPETAPHDRNAGTDAPLNNVILRAYRPGDLQAIFALDQICFAPPFRFSKRAMRQFAESRNALTVVAENGDSAEIAGFCIAHVERFGEERLAYIVTLDVAPEQRRHGLAHALMTDVEQQARAAGCGGVELHVSVENLGAIRFYEREGYAQIGLARRFYGVGGDAWVYAKELLPAGLLKADSLRD